MTNQGLIFRLSAMVALASLAAPAAAQTTPGSLCAEVPYETGYFNGVGKTKLQAQAEADALPRVLGTAAPDGAAISYKLFYNTTSGKLIDVLEAFDQNLRNQPAAISNKFELFWEAIDGNTTLTRQVVSILPAYNEIADAANASFQQLAVNAIANVSRSSRPFTSYADQKAQIDNAVLVGSKIILVAHSQGNIFANKAFDYTQGEAGAGSVKLVHIAPATNVLHGPYTLADLDLVINVLLRIAGVLPQPNVKIRETGNGHGLFEVYLNTALSEPIAKILRDYRDALGSVIAPPRQAAVGFFTVTLSWDGPGDVDLHTFEPDGSHVYYSTPRGQSGILDVDNTSADGPEHYYASCDANTLQTGIYRIGINNYSRATGRTAVVQVNSLRNGLLTSRSLSVGPELGSRGDANPIPVVNVVVTRNAGTNAFSVTVN